MAAALRRNENTVNSSSEVQEHEKRQAFRRLINPGILRPNSKEAALTSLKTLATIAENMLREPDNPKYQQFKSTNDLIKRRLMDTKGALEYAIELGFRPEVKALQPYYVFNPRYMENLCIGAAILKEAIDLETEKQGRMQRNRAEEKAAAAAAAQNVKLAFLDDRKTKALHDQRERSRREACKSDNQAGDVNVTGEDSPSGVVMSGAGYTLASSHPEE